MNLLNFDIIEPAPEQPDPFRIFFGVIPILVLLLMIVLILLIKQIRKRKLYINETKIKGGE